MMPKVKHMRPSVAGARLRHHVATTDDGFRWKTERTMRISASNTMMEIVPPISHACAYEGRLPNTSVTGLNTCRYFVMAFWKGAGNSRKDSGRSSC
jgi:hypothetical protein